MLRLDKTTKFCKAIILQLKKRATRKSSCSTQRGADTVLINYGGGANYGGGGVLLSVAKGEKLKMHYYSAARDKI